MYSPSGKIDQAQFGGHHSLCGSPALGKPDGDSAFPVHPEVRNDLAVNAVDGRAVDEGGAIVLDLMQV